MKLAAVLAVLLSVGVAHADPGPIPMDPYDDARPPRAEHKQGARVLRQALVQQFDQDGDGRLAPEERQQAARALHRLAKRLQGDGHHKGQRGQRGQRGAGRRERLIRRFDLNGDGNLGPGELPPRVRERLRRLDRNGDDFIGPGELR